MYSKLWNCNRLWKIWYCLLMILLQFYVTYNAIRNYIVFKSQYYNPRFGGMWNIGPLHLYIGCIVTSISLMGFFIYFCIINFQIQPSSDIRSYLNMENENINHCLGPIYKLVMKLMREKLPYAPMLHLLMAFFLLIPLPVVQMEQIRNEALSPESMWIANFDFFSDHFSWFMMDSLPNVKSFKNLHYITKASVLSIEFVNFIIAAIIFLIRLPSVLWYSHKWFSILYSAIIFFNCITWLIIYEAGSIFIKCSGNIGTSKSISKLANQIQYSTMWSFIMIHFLLTLMGIIAIFDYGQTQSAICWLRGFKTFSCFNRKHIKNCWIGLVIGIGFFLLVITLIVDSLIFVAYFNSFQILNLSIFLVAIIFGIITLVLQFLVWFTFSIKTSWDFHLNLPNIVPNSNLINENENKYTGSPDMYGCFHNNITLSTSSSHSSGRGTTRTVEGSSADSICYGNNYQSYIYLPNNPNQIPTISEDYDENNTNTSKSSSINITDNRNNLILDQEALYRTTASISDNGLNKINENLNSDSYRSLQMINSRKGGKLVTFNDIGEEKLPFLNSFEKRFSNNTMDQLNFLKVPDILNMNRSTLSGSLSESSLDQISSSLSSKAAIETNDNGMCSEV